MRRKELLKVTGIICIIVPHPSRFLQGIDLIWESVGGDMFTTCTRALAQGGRLIVIGMMSQYSDGWAPSRVTFSCNGHAPVVLCCTVGDVLSIRSAIAIHQLGHLQPSLYQQLLIAAKVCLMDT